MKSKIHKALISACIAHIVTGMIIISVYAFTYFISPDLFATLQPFMPNITFGTSVASSIIFGLLALLE